MEQDRFRERRARDVRWFEVRTDPPARHGGGQPVERAYGDPWAYVVGFAGLPLAFVLAVALPFGGPRWVYGGLIFLSALPGWNMVQAWAEEGRFSAYSRRAMAAQAWLYFGGALRQAIRAIKERRGRR